MADAQPSIVPSLTFSQWVVLAARPNAALPSSLEAYSKEPDLTRWYLKINELHWM